MPYIGIRLAAVWSGAGTAPGNVIIILKKTHFRFPEIEWPEGFLQHPHTVSAP